MSFSLRKCGPGDKARLSILGSATDLETYAGLGESDDLLARISHEQTTEAYRDRLQDPQVTIWSIEIDAGKTMVGYAMLVRDARDGPATGFRLERLYVLHRFHGQGLGKCLMLKAIENATHEGAGAITLRVLSTNERAVAFYKRFGFHVADEDSYQLVSKSYRMLVLMRKL